MTIFVDVLLVVLSFVFIAYPFFSQKRGLSAYGDDARFRELHSRRDTTYSMLKEIEFDYQSGILNEEDYRDLEARFKRNAISILKDADGLEKGEGTDRDIEEQVKKLRLAKSNKSEGQTQKASPVKSSNLENEVEEEILKLRKGQVKFCPQCGTKSQEGDHFCASCGTKLK